MYKLFILIFSISLFACSPETGESNKKSQSEEKKSADKGLQLVNLSQKLIETVKKRENTDAVTQKYANISMGTLVKSLDTDAKKKAFWINTYNGFIQVLLLEDPSLFDNRDQFFKKERITIADRKLSFDDIEHGIIRNSKIKWSAGFLGKPFPPSWEKDLRVSEVDYRIHFAINCGAKSCPGVQKYSAETIDSELEKSTSKYLAKTVKYNKDEGVVKVPALMNWFRGDFNGKDGTLKILKDFALIPEDKAPEIQYLSYDWTLDLENFQ